MAKEPKLYGQSKWEVQNLADDIVRVRESKGTRPKVYDAAMKLLKVRQRVLGSILQTASNRSKE